MTIPPSPEVGPSEHPDLDALAAQLKGLGESLDVDPVTPQPEAVAADDVESVPDAEQVPDAVDPADGTTPDADADPAGAVDAGDMDADSDDHTATPGDGSDVGSHDDPVDAAPMPAATADGEAEPEPAPAPAAIPTPTAEPASPPQGVRGVEQRNFVVSPERRPARVEVLHEPDGWRDLGVSAIAFGSEMGNSAGKVNHEDRGLVGGNGTILMIDGMGGYKSTNAAGEVLDGSHAARQAAEGAKPILAETSVGTAAEADAELAVVLTGARRGIADWAGRELPDVAVNERPGAVAMALQVFRAPDGSLQFRGRTAGDCRAIVISTDGRLKRFDGAMVDGKGVAGSPEQIDIDEPSTVTNYLGPVDGPCGGSADALYGGTLEEGDTVVIATDGLFGDRAEHRLTPEQYAAVAGMSVDDATEYLLRQRLKVYDDAEIIVFRVDNAAPTAGPEADPAVVPDPDATAPDAGHGATPAAAAGAGTDPSSGTDRADTLAALLASAPRMPERRPRRGERRAANLAARLEEMRDDAYEEDGEEYYTDAAVVVNNMLQALGVTERDMISSLDDSLDLRALDAMAEIGRIAHMHYSGRTGADGAPLNKRDAVLRWISGFQSDPDSTLYQHVSTDTKAFLLGLAADQASADGATSARAMMRKAAIVELVGPSIDDAKAGIGSRAYKKSVTVLRQYLEADGGKRRNAPRDYVYSLGAHATTFVFRHTHMSERSTARRQRRGATSSEARVGTATVLVALYGLWKVADAVARAKGWDLPLGIGDHVQHGGTDHIEAATSHSPTPPSVTEHPTPTRTPDATPPSPTGRSAASPTGAPRSSTGVVPTTAPTQHPSSRGATPGVGSTTGVPHSSGSGSPAPSTSHGNPASPSPSPSGSPIPEVPPAGSGHPNPGTPEVGGGNLGSDYTIRSGQGLSDIARERLHAHGVPATAANLQTAMDQIKADNPGEVHAVRGDKYGLIHAGHKLKMGHTDAVIEGLKAHDAGRQPSAPSAQRANQIISDLRNPSGKLASVIDTTPVKPGEGLEQYTGRVLDQMGLKGVDTTQLRHEIIGYISNSTDPDISSLRSKLTSGSNPLLYSQTAGGSHELRINRSGDISAAHAAQLRAIIAHVMDDQSKRIAEVLAEELDEAA